MLSGPSKATIVVSCVLPVLATLAVTLRFYARRSKSLALRADDYAVLLALIVTVASCVPYIIGATIGGIGRHIEELTKDESVIFGKVLFALQFTYIGAVTLVKLSILLFYYRLFPTTKFKIAVQIMSSLTIIWFIAFFWATLFQAIPISINWDHKQSGTVIDEYAMYTASAVVEMVLDVATLLLPWPMIWTLQLSTHRKWVVSGIFLLGGFVCVTSVVRLYYLVQYLSPSAQETEDFTYDLTNIIIWSAIEPCAGIICACLPVFAPIFRGRSPESLLGSIRSYLSFRSLRGRSSQSSFNNEKDMAAGRSKGSMLGHAFRTPESENFGSTV